MGEVAHQLLADVIMKLFQRFTPLYRPLNQAEFSFTKIICLTFCVGLIGIVLSGCRSLEAKTSQINPGDDKKQVLAIMGTPGDRQFRGAEEAWQYRKMRVGGFNFVVIWFNDGRVSGITSYTQYGSALSDATTFKSVRWEDAPNYTFEIRNQNEN